MIPKTIHYCWFGGKDLPKEYKRYIESWLRFLPDYEVIRWDESNYDVDGIPFTKEAYAAGKYAYVSDYARLKILYEHGGVYFDTDVEVIRPLDDILARGAFMGSEKNTLAKPDEPLPVAVGLGFAVEAGNPIIKELMERYENTSFLLPDGTQNAVTIVVLLTEILKRYGLKRSSEPQRVAGITIYPPEYFCPKEFSGLKIEITENTRTIHHYSGTWMSWPTRILANIGYYNFVFRVKRMLRLN